MVLQYIMLETNVIYDLKHRISHTRTHTILSQ